MDLNWFPGFGFDSGPNLQTCRTKLQVLSFQMSGLASGQRCPAQPQPAPCGAKTRATVYWGAQILWIKTDNSTTRVTTISTKQRNDFFQFLGSHEILAAGVEWQRDRKDGSLDRNRFSLRCFLNRRTSQMLARTQKDASQHNWLGCGCIPRKRSFITKIQIMSFYDGEMLRKQKIKVLGSLKGNK